MLLFYTTDEQSSPETYWPAVGRLRADWFDRATKPDESIRKGAGALVEGATSDLERVERLARWVRSRFRIVRSSSSDSLRAADLRPSSDARSAWRQGGGRYLDAELVFAALARAVGLEARWVMVSSRSQLFFDQRMLNDGYLNSYQVAIRLGGKWSTFDPVTRYLPWDMRPWDEEATLGLVCDRDSSVFVETGFSQPERTVQTRSADLALQPDGTLEGTMHVSWTGHFNDEQRTRLADVDPKDLDSLATDMQVDDGARVQLSNVTLMRGADESAPLGMSAKVVLPQFATVTEKRILLEPAVLHAHAKPRYSSSTRQHPVYYRFPWTEVDTVRIRVPEGWKVETVDSAEPLTAEGVADYSANVMVSDDRRQVFYLRRFRMGIDGSILIAPKFYPGVRHLFDEIQRRDRVSIVLTRAEAKP